MNTQNLGHLTLKDSKLALNSRHLSLKMYKTMMSRITIDVACTLNSLTSGSRELFGSTILGQGLSLPAISPLPFQAQKR